jgi:predicted RNase H-related nuclease YkuK (DUF458 family)
VIYFSNYFTYKIKNVEKIKNVKQRVFYEKNKKRFYIYGMTYGAVQILRNAGGGVVGLV